MQNFKSLSLNGTYEMAVIMHSDYETLGLEPKSLNDLQSGGIEIIPAEVPGNFELDLYRAGKIPDPFYADNIIALQKYEYAHIFYSKKFDYSAPSGKFTPVLHFDGIDTFADIYLNGRKIAHTDNMLIPHEIIAENLTDGENELFVHIYPTCLEARKVDLCVADFAMKYNFASLATRKAAHSFGWDIMPRAVSGGLWRSVSLVDRPEKYVREVYLYTKHISGDHKYAYCELFYNFELGCDTLDGYNVRVRGKCGDSVFESSSRLWFTQGKLGIDIHEPKLWWCVGRGEQNLYDVEVTLEKNGEVIASEKFRVGIRTIELIRSEVLDENCKGDFVFRLNGERVFIKGSNWVPADAYHSRDRERIPKMLELWSDIGCNALRSWGGGVYEDDEFYDICDERGIMVWTDFCMGCGSYPQTPEMCEKFGKEAEIIVKKLRHHPSLILWAGDNENDSFVMFSRDPNQNVLTRKVLPEVIRLHDATRPYLPSSPYISPDAFRIKDEKRLPENHLWGPRDYFKSDFYKNATAIFASEMGYHGCPSPASIKKFISPAQLGEKNLDSSDWITHCASPEMRGSFTYRNALMISHVRTLFGIENAENLDLFARASQISQAEAKKYFVERFRCRKWDRTGVIWWNIIDGWPQVSDAIVDYYFTKKLAYSYIKRSQRDLCLMFDEPEGGYLPIIASNDTRDKLDFTFEVHDMTDGGKIIASGKSSVAGDSAERIYSIPYDGEAKTFYYIKWEAGENSGDNHYLAGRPPYDLGKYLEIIHALGYDLFEGFDE
ncbi:MAG: glycoside hydrolase family 2 protein [Eubacteriales bacterium]